MPISKTKLRLLEIGDVIKTHPKDGFWGCAVVLNAREKVDRFHPMCHIGITPLVFQHDYTWDEIDGLALSIMEIDRRIRLGPNDYSASRHEICIGIYTRKQHSELPVIGRVNPANVFTGPLGFEPGNATNGKWPWCGPIQTHLGGEAIGAWRSIHDSVNARAESEASQKEHEEILLRIKEKERQLRLKYKLKKALNRPTP